MPALRRSAFSRQLSVFAVYLSEEWNFRVSIFPESQEFLVRLTCSGIITTHRLGSRQLQMRQSGDWGIQDDAAIAEHLLKFRCRLLTLPLLQISQPAQIDRIKKGDGRRRRAGLIRRGRPQSLNGSLRIL